MKSLCIYINDTFSLNDCVNWTFSALAPWTSGGFVLCKFSHTSPSIHWIPEAPPPSHENQNISPNMATRSLWGKIVPDQEHLGLIFKCLQSHQFICQSVSFSEFRGFYVYQDCNY